MLKGGTVVRIVHRTIQYDTHRDQCPDDLVSSSLHSGLLSSMTKHPLSGGVKEGSISSANDDELPLPTRYRSKSSKVSKHLYF